MIMCMYVCICIDKKQRSSRVISRDKCQNRGAPRILPNGSGTYFGSPRAPQERPDSPRNQKRALPKMPKDLRRREIPPIV